MDTKFAKVLDSRRILNDLKRKRALQSMAYNARATSTNIALPSVFESPLSKSNKISKRRKLDISNSQYGWCSSQSKSSLLRYYSNLKRSAPPASLMCYQKGEWTNLPQGFVTSVKKEFQIKKTAMEVELDGKMFLIDFLHMMILDLETGAQQPIAWIDEEDTCFFPEIFYNHDEINENCYSENEQVDGHVVPKSHGANDIKLQLEIDISGSDYLKLRESTGESNDLVRKIKGVEKPAVDAEADNSCIRVSNEEICEAFGENQQDENMVRYDRGNMDCNTVQEMFLKAFSSVKVDEVIATCGSGIQMQARLELFQKQVEITEKYRGDANVKYAWLPMSRGELSNVMCYGLGECEMLNMKSSYGSGILLLPVNCVESRSVYTEFINR